MPNFLVMDPGMKVILGSVQGTNRGNVLMRLQRDDTPPPDGLPEGLPESGFAIVALAEQGYSTKYGLCDMDPVHLHLRWDAEEAERAEEKEHGGAGEFDKALERMADGSGENVVLAKPPGAEMLHEFAEKEGLIADEPLEPKPGVRKCAICGKELKKTQRAYCSRDCYYASKKE